MMEKHKNIPSLRFPEFTGEWQRKKLGEVAKKIGDGLHGTPEYSENTGYYFINGNNLIDGKIKILETTKEISVDEYKSNYKELTKNTILISINGTIGNIARFDDEYVMLGKSVGYFIFNQDCTFLYHLLKTENIQNHFISELTGTTIKNLSLKTLRETEIHFPSLQEQTRIASFFTILDKKITELKQKKTLLEQYKKGVMQKLFSQELRFKDDDGKEFPNWEKKKLGEIVEIIGGGTPETNNGDYWHGSIQWFTPTEIKSDYVSKSQRTITELGLKKSSANILPKGAILLTTRATIGEASIALEECTTNQGFQSLIVNETNNNIFIFNWIKKNKLELIKRASGSIFPEISKSEIKKIVISVPNLVEQTRIANFLSAIDEKINRTQTQIQKTELYKKGLLQKMFV